MPSRSNAFQRLIYRIQRTLAKPNTVSESCMLAERLTNVGREVDIVIEVPVATSRLTISIECVARGRKATVEWVEQMIAKHSNLPTNHLILVSQAGFTPAAIQKASNAGVATITLETAVEADWTQVVGKLSRIWFARFDFATTAFEVQLVDTGDQWHKIGDAQQLTRADGTGAATAGQVSTSLIHRPEIATAIMENVSTDGEKRATYEVAPSDDCWTRDTKGRSHQVSKIKLSFIIKRITSPIDLTHAAFDKVPVAFGSGETAFGMTEVTVVEPAGFGLGGYVRLTDPNTGKAKDFALNAPVKSEGGPTVQLHLAAPPPE